MVLSLWSLTPGRSKSVAVVAGFRASFLGNGNNGFFLFGRFQALRTLNVDCATDPFRHEHAAAAFFLNL
jgi:hypothetical protein